MWQCYGTATHVSSNARWCNGPPCRPAGASAPRSAIREHLWQSVGTHLEPHSARRASYPRYQAGSALHAEGRGRTSGPPAPTWPLRWHATVWAATTPGCRTPPVAAMPGDLYDHLDNAFRHHRRDRPSNQAVNSRADSTGYILSAEVVPTDPASVEPMTGS